MPSSSEYAGQLIDTRVIRSVTDITGTDYQGEIEVPPNYRLVANVFHNGEFYTALIPTDGVAQEKYLIEPFDVILPHLTVTLAHQMILFEMSKPIWLVAKTPTLQEFESGDFKTKQADLLPEPLLLTEIIASPQPAGPYGTNVADVSDGLPFGPWLDNGRGKWLRSILKNARVGTRVLATRLISVTSQSKGISEERAGEITTVALKPNPEFGNASLMKVIDDSTRDGMTILYDMLFTRCDTYCLNVLGTSRPGVSMSNRSYMMFVAAPFLDFINRFQWMTRIFPPLTPLSVMTRLWTDSDPEVGKLAESEEFQRLHADPPPKSCEVQLQSHAQEDLSSE